MNEYEYELSEMYNRFFDLITIGRVTEVSEDGKKARIMLKGHETPFMIIARNRSGEDDETWTPSIKEMVVAIAPEGKLECGIIIASIPKEDSKEHKNEYSKKFKDGTEIKYNKEKSELNITLKETGKANIAVGKTKINFNKDNVEIVADNIALNSTQATKIKIDGDAIINGNTVKIESATKVDINGTKEINLNGKDGNVVTTKCVCSFTGALHPMGSARVSAGTL